MIYNLTDLNMISFSGGLGWSTVGMPMFIVKTCIQVNYLLLIIEGNALFVEG